MASLHIRNASVNTAFEARPQTADAGALQPRSRTPVGHNRGRSLGTTEMGEMASEPLLQDEPKHISIKVPNRQRNGHATLASLWVLSLIATSFFTYTWSRRPSAPSLLGTFDTGYETELRNARSSIRVQKQQFHGSLDFENRHGFIPIGSPSLKYVGETPEVDAAWAELTDGRYFLLDDQEARDAYGSSPEPYWNVHHGGYVAGLDVLHTLHCLNHLRMSLYPKQYPQDPQHGTMHKAHCVDHLRQLAMCHADLTPVPTQWFVGLSRNYINSSREHTCRDFWQIRDWASKRFNGSLTVKPRNRDGTPRENFYAPWTP